MASEHWRDIMSAPAPTKILPGFTDEAFPNNFNLKARPVVKEKKVGQLPEAKIKQFFEEVSHYVVLP